MGCGASKKKKDKKKGDATPDQQRNEQVDAASPRPLVKDGTRSLIEGAHPELPVDEAAPPPQPAPALPEGDAKAEWELDLAWTAESAGGCVNHPTWWKNPQVFLSNANGHTAPIQVTVTMTMLDSKGDVKPSQQDPVGLYVIRSDNSHRRYKAIARNDVVERSEFAAVAQVVLQDITLPAVHGGGYILLPCTFDPNITAQFKLSVKADAPVIVRDHPSWHERDVNITWDDKTAGGCANFITWRENPQVQITLTKTPTKMSVVLHRGDKSDDAANKTKFGMMVLKSTVPGQKVHTLTKTNVVHKTSYTPNPQVGLDLELEGGEPFVILPSTFNSGVVQSARLQICTDHPVIIKELSDPYSWREATTTAEWKPGLDGGSIQERLTFRDNPRFVIQPSDPDLGTLGLLYLEQDDSVGATFQDAGYYVYKLPQPISDPLPVILDPEHLIYRSTFQASARVLTDVAAMHFDADSTFVIVPTARLPGKHAEFKLCLLHYSRIPVSIVPRQEWTRTEVAGQWTTEQSGGCANHATWTQNPTMAITVPSTDSLVSIFLQLDGALRDSCLEDASFTPPVQIGMYLLPKPNSVASAIAKSKYQATVEVKIVDELVPHREEPYLLVPTTFEPGFIGSFRVIVYSTQPDVTVKNISM